MACPLRCLLETFCKLRLTVMLASMGPALTAFSAVHLRILLYRRLESQLGRNAGHAIYHPYSTRGPTTNTCLPNPASTLLTTLWPRDPRSASTRCILPSEESVGDPLPAANAKPAVALILI